MYAQYDCRFPEMFVYSRNKIWSFMIRYMERMCKRPMAYGRLLFLVISSWERHGIHSLSQYMCRLYDHKSCKKNTTLCHPWSSRKHVQSHWFQSEFHICSHLSFISLMSKVKRLWTKICSSKWVHLPQFSGWKFQKMFELPPPKKSVDWSILIQRNHTSISSGSHFSHPSRSGWGTAACEGVKRSSDGG